MKFLNLSKIFYEDALEIFQAIVAYRFGSIGPWTVGMEV